MELKVITKKKKKSYKEPVQYTKILFNRLLALVTITVIIGMYINYKNGFSMDAIVSSLLEALKYSIPSYCLKSLFETDKEKKYDLEKTRLEIEKMKLDINREKLDDNQ